MNPPGSACRTPEYAVDRLFLDRWSPRSLVPDPIPDADLFAILEAAGWAPSSYNNQPWRILYARNGTPLWPLFFDLLDAGNKAWAKDAAVLLLFVSNAKFDRNGKPCLTHSFDCGAAWQNIALEATMKGYAAHGMQGFDLAKARVVLEVPDDFQVEAMAALGRQGPKAALPENLREMESPSPRRPLAETVAEGKFSCNLLHAKKQ